MKKTLLFLIVVISLIGCNQPKTTLVIKKEPPDTLFVSKSQNKVLVLSESQRDLINTFRQPLKDVAYYMILHEESFKLDRFTFSCGEYEFWVANGYGWFELDKPIEIELKRAEKEYFWNIYVNYRDNEMRLFEWENTVEIK